jgi:hypothetical protein
MGYIGSIYTWKRINKIKKVVTNAATRKTAAGPILGPQGNCRNSSRPVLFNYLMDTNGSAAVLRPFYGIWFVVVGAGVGGGGCYSLPEIKLVNIYYVPETSIISLRNCC